MPQVGLNFLQLDLFSSSFQYSINHALYLYVLVLIKKQSVRVQYSM